LNEVIEEAFQPACRLAWTPPWARGSE
jgi:hypothetical protein